MTPESHSHAVRLKLLDDNRKPVCEEDTRRELLPGQNAPEIGVIIGAIWQWDVHVADLLAHWEVAFAVHAEGEHCWVILEDEGVSIPLQIESLLQGCVNGSST